MILQYTDIFDDKKTHKIEVEITTEHSSSLYGMPVIVLPSGYALSAESWVMLGYNVVSCAPEEKPLMKRWIENLYTMFGEMGE